MFEGVISITKNYAIVKVSNNINDDILNYNVIFEDENRRILGEIEEVINNEAKISFLGEFINNEFFSGIIRRPTLHSNIRIINRQELGILVGDNDNRTMILGTSPLYNNYPIKVNINEMFSNNMAILGSAGSGKTYAVARIIQNFFNMKDKIPFNSNFFIFNNTNEYEIAFRDINKINPNFNYKLFTTDKTNSNGNLIRIPLWLMDVDDYVNILEVNSYSQISIIEKMLKIVSIFAKNDEKADKYKNNLIAKAIISVLYSNQVAAKIRDQIFNILSDCYTDQLNLDVEVPGIGYTIEFRKCFDIDNHGEFVEKILITKYIQSFINNNIDDKEQFEPVFFTLDQLEVALNFTLISDGLILNDKSYSEALALKVKLHAINNSSNREFFDVPNFITVEQYINSLLLTPNNGRVQIVNFVLEEVDDRLAKSMVKVISRILFKFAKRLQPRGAMPMNIMLEEAHRYVQKDNDVNILGYNIFERIAKEGRKFGVIMNLITQRPAELSETVLSQCSNFMIFKLNQSTDLDYISKVIPNISSDVIDKQKLLQSGFCVVFGKMMHIPMIVKIQMPNPEPQNTSTSIYDKWMVEWKS
jgi:DNA helicase HerA-like ATPase